ncbi:MAG: transporter substrate-binding domain-containing protein, partial [Lachnospiraceae bacterium]|nr:transporter substrate-binding domain-containing protein [Lachnospiraceae bacterium]
MRQRDKISWIKSWLRGVGGIFLLCMVLAAVPQRASGAMQETTVRVAVFPLGQFQYFDAEGEARGYNIDYLAKLGQTTHWNYEYVEAENFQDACNQMKEGKVDLVAPVQHKDYLVEDFDYSAYAMATECAAIYTLNKEDNSDLMYEDFDRMSQMKFAAVYYEKSSFTQKFLDEYVVQHNFMPENITYFDNMTQVLEALRSGQADAAVTNILFAADDLKILGRFAPMT